MDFNKSGQLLGQKGLGTRKRIVTALEQLLRASRGVSPSVAALAREAGISPPTFYSYFADVDEVIADVVEGLHGRLDSVLTLLEIDWPEDEVFQYAEAFVIAYFDYWIEGASALRARNRLADLGNERFVAMRIDSTNRLMTSLTAKFSNPPVPDGLPCEPASMAGALVTAIERNATVLVLKLYSTANQDMSDSIRALANLIAMTIRGR